MPALSITPDLIREALAVKGARSAPGSDNVTYGQLRSGGSLFLKRLASIFSKILDPEDPLQIPPEWTTIRVRMIHKGKGKDPALWDSFRPISISSCIGKLFNAIIERQLYKHVIDEDLLDTAVQKGFLRRVSGVTDQIQSFWNCAQSVSAALAASACTAAIAACSRLAWTGSRAGRSSNACQGMEGSLGAVI